MLIYFVRHASAGKSLSDPAHDAKRPLDKAGVRQSAYVGRALAALETQVEVIISSPLKRAAQTASLVANELAHDRKIMFSEALGKDAEFNAFQELLRKYAKHDAIMVVGHNPSLSRFLSNVITGATNGRAVELKKGAVARVDYDGRKPAMLQWCITPRIVETVYQSAKTSSRPKTSRK
jgi:phosphohistidine phosphatase